MNPTDWTHLTHLTHLTHRGKYGAGSTLESTHLTPLTHRTHHGRLAYTLEGGGCGVSPVHLFYTPYTPYTLTRGGHTHTHTHTEVMSECGKLPLGILKNCIKNLWKNSEENIKQLQIDSPGIPKNLNGFSIGGGGREEEEGREGKKHGQR